ncbi:MAG TPA: T9SS type A sorting domain-containing protein [Chitinophagales bacterium]|nr:T9SS type A sorting domain-containing protein [Chitinophagales bacterium]HRG26903.1 T9SS type A sorting domain-containing protein [Chitinophagales bacterium]HRG85207.1 T9SS type A sorting domain-containing protein [Chitinophagales bacterium]HRH52269.1 T9SS type A sorting domain-containing protein [Chitinophagales bacterium]
MRTKSKHLFNLEKLAKVFLFNLSLFIFLFQGNLLKAENYFYTNYLFEPNIINNCLPDSTFDDSLNVYSDGDTVSLFTSGADTLIVLYASESADTNSSAKLIPFATEDMVISINSNNQPVQHGLYGINVSDLFEHVGEFTPDGTPNPYYLQSWDDIARLDPAVIRAFSGSGSKFMHPLGSDNTDPLNPFVISGLTRNGGYGYCIEEIINYYENTDGTPFDAPPLNLIIADMGLPTPVLSWMNPNEKGAFKEYYNKWNNQPHFDPTVIPDIEDQPLYINQLIRLVAQIETFNTLSGKVDVILAINILSQTVNEIKDLLNYLVVDNPIWPVQVVGIELGNESYFPSHNRLIGFSDFDHYWYFINGGNDYQTEFSDPLDFELTDVLSLTMQADHDFIGDLRSLIPFEFKIGIPAMNLPNGAGWAFKTANPEDTLYPPVGNPEGFSPCELSWNQCLALHYDEMVGEDYAFDAVILHPYYTPSNDPAAGFGTNWGRIPTNYDVDPLNLTPNHLDNDILTDNGYQDFVAPMYDYTTPDTRLQTVFEGMVGIPISDDGGLTYYEGTGNIKALIRTRYKESYDEHAGILNFQSADVGPQYKELWTTEWNFHDADHLDFLPIGYLGANQISERLAVYTNTLVHLDLVQEWYLKNLKMNLQPGYRHNFFTYSTIQNIAGGSNITMLSESKQQDQIQKGLIASCAEIDLLPDYYIKKGSYYGFSLLKTIYEKNLYYISSTTSMYIANNNLAPTVFLAPSEKKLFIYYTNIKNIPQRYIIDPNNLVSVYPGALGVSFSAPSILCVDPKQLYSTSGRSSILENITNQYPCTTDITDYPDWFDLKSAASIPGFAFVSCPPGVPADCKCVEVPATSVGYVEIPFTLLRLGELEDIYRIYPNPTSEYFIVELVTPFELENNDFQVDILSMTGMLIKSVLTGEGQKIDIQDIPVGVYNVMIRKEGFAVESEVLVKMK